MSRTLSVDGRAVELSKPGKVLFPESGITKGDLAEYYARIAPVALPHLRDRPLTMQRFPDGIAAEGFFQKDAPDYFPQWIERAEMKKEGGSVKHVVANDAATLAYLADQGCITPHVGLSRIDRIDRPDRLVFDLDPPGRDFAKVQAAARALEGLLDELELGAFVQTTGSRGLHVVVPLDRSADFETVRSFARAAAARLADRHPGDLTVEQRKDKRRGRVYLDCLRNAYGQTMVAPYAVRAREGAPVATPLDWSEAFAGDLTPDAYTIGTIFRRLAQKDDPWSGIGRHAQSLTRAQERLEDIAG